MPKCFMDLIASVGKMGAPDCMVGDDFAAGLVRQSDTLPDQVLMRCLTFRWLPGDRLAVTGIDDRLDIARVVPETFPRRTRKRKAGGVIMVTLTFLVPSARRQSHDQLPSARFLVPTAIP